MIWNYHATDNNVSKYRLFDDFFYKYTEISGPLLNLARQKVSIQEYVFSQKVKYLEYLIKLFTSTVYKLTAFDLQDVKNGRFQRAVVYRIFICQKKYLRQLKACLLKSQLVEAWSIWSFIAWWKSVLLRGYRKWSKIVCSKTTIISVPKSKSDFL
jgi:hypothetical protein